MQVIRNALKWFFETEQATLLILSILLLQYVCMDVIKLYHEGSWFMMGVGVFCMVTIVQSTRDWWDRVDVVKE